MISPTKLTNLQVELLQTFAYSLPEEQLKEIRQLLAQYFLAKADEEMDKLSLKHDWDDTTYTAWATGHERTPYTPQP